MRRGSIEDARLNCSPHDIRDAQAKLRGVAIGRPSQMAQCENVLSPRNRRLNSLPGIVFPWLAPLLVPEGEAIDVQLNRLPEAVHRGNALDHERARDQSAAGVARPGWEKMPDSRGLDVWGVSTRKAGCRQTQA